MAMVIAQITVCHPYIFNESAQKSLFTSHSKPSPNLCNSTKLTFRKFLLKTCGCDTVICAVIIAINPPYLIGLLIFAKNYLRNCPLALRGIYISNKSLHKTYVIMKRFTVHYVFSSLFVQPKTQLCRRLKPVCRTERKPARRSRLNRPRSKQSRPLNSAPRLDSNLIR